MKKLFEIDENIGDVSSFPEPVKGRSHLINRLRYLATHRDSESLFQSLLDIGYEEWQKPEHERWSFSNMIDWMAEEYGEEAAFLIMLGKFNQQVENGGISQWIENGYTSSGRRSRRNHINTSLLERMLDDFQESPLKKSDTGRAIFFMLEEIKDTIESATGYCSSCNNHRYISCSDCDGSGFLSDEDCPDCGGTGKEEGRECFECRGEGKARCGVCAGEGEVSCEECNPEGQVELDAEQGEVNYTYFEEVLDNQYSAYSSKWMNEIENYIKQMVRTPSGGGLLSRAQAFKATENYLNILEQLLEEIEDME